MANDRFKDLSIEERIKLITRPRSQEESDDITAIIDSLAWTKDYLDDEDDEVPTEAH